jgi:hypothetical protein
MPSMANYQRALAPARRFRGEPDGNGRRDAVRHWLLVQLLLSAAAWGLVAAALSLAA